MPDNPAPESTPSWELLYPEIWRGTDDQRIRITFVAGPSGQPADQSAREFTQVLSEATPKFTTTVLMRMANQLAGFAKRIALEQAADGDMSALHGLMAIHGEAACIEDAKPVITFSK